MLDKEYKYFESIAQELAEKHPHKFAVIKGEEVLGIYDSITDALAATAKNYKLGTFIVQRCEPLEQSIQRFHSRVSFTCTRHL